MKTVLLLDADIIAYRFAATAERAIDWGDGQEKVRVVEPIESPISEMESYIKELVAKLEADSYIVCLSCPSSENWRLNVLPSYKENRKDTIRPELLMGLKDHLEANHPTYKRPSLEADDVMGILSTWKGFEPDAKKIIVSEDKDMKTIPGWLFNPAKDEAPYEISTGEADAWHIYQSLVGDTADGYKGCPGIGPKKATKLLDPFTAEYPECVHFDVGPAWTAVVETYKAKGLTEQDALIQARVSRICRASDYDFQNKQVKLWMPPTSS